MNSNINIDIDLFRIEYNFLYNYNSDETIFTKEGIKNFYNSISIIFAIIINILDNDIVEKLDICKIPKDVIDKACLYSNNIIRGRDRSLLFLTKKSELYNSVKIFFQRQRTNFIYQRDLRRIFSSYSASTFNDVLIMLLDSGLIEEWRIKNGASKKDTIIYRYVKMFSNNEFFKNITL